MKYPEQGNPETNVNWQLQETRVPEALGMTSQGYDLSFGVMKKCWIDCDECEQQSVLENHWAVSFPGGFV